MIKKSKKSLLADKVSDRIHSGKVKMRPKVYFILKTVLIILGIILAGLFVLFLMSFIFFVLRARGVWYLPGFGLPGIRALFVLLPWLLFLTAIGLIAVLEILFKHFAFTYRRPILYSILGIVVLIFLGSFIIHKTSLHSGLFRRAQQGHLPIAGKFYRDFALPKSASLHRGVVSKITDNGFIMKMPNEEMLTVVINEKTRLPLPNKIKPNDTLIILGQRDDHTIQCFGIRQINDEFNFSPPSRPPLR